MFEALSDKLRKVLKDLRGQGRLTEAHVDAAMREIRIALLEADVNYKVVKTFIDRVKVKALGQEVMGSLSPAQRQGDGRRAAEVAGETGDAFQVQHRRRERGSQW